MSVSRRSVLKLGLAAAATAAPISRGIAQKRPVLVVFDSRLPESLAFARAQGGRVLDIAREPALLWRNLRNPLPPGRIVGMTRWSDLVLVRGALEDQGRRMRSQSQSGRHTPFVWEMA
jgi:hypothetical protein